MYIEHAYVDTIHEDLFMLVRIYFTFYIALSNMFWSSPYISVLSYASCRDCTISPKMEVL